jgi:hypothetical protein
MTEPVSHKQVTAPDLTAPVVVKKGPQGYFCQMGRVFVPVEVQKTTGFFDWIYSLFGWAQWVTAEVEICDNENPTAHPKKCIVQLNIQSLTDFQNGIVTAAAKAGMQMKTALANSQKILSALGESKHPETARANAQQLQNCFRYAAEQYQRVEKAFDQMASDAQGRADKNLRIAFIARLDNCLELLKKEGCHHSEFLNAFNGMMELAERLGIPFSRDEVLNRDDLKEIRSNLERLEKCERALKFLDSGYYGDSDIAFLIDLIKSLEDFTDADADHLEIARKFEDPYTTGEAIAEAKKVLEKAVSKIRKENAEMVGRFENQLIQMNTAVSQWREELSKTAPAPQTKPSMAAYRAILAEPLPDHLEKQRAEKQKQKEAHLAAKQKLAEGEVAKPETYAQFKQLARDLAALRPAVFF